MSGLGSWWRCVACSALVICTVIASTAGEATAQSSWQRMGMFRKIDADPNKDYTLAEANGPWMIMAVTFTGEKAEQQAKDLVLELRRDFKLPAYTHRVHFDYSDGTIGRGTNRYGSAPKMRYRVNERTEIAVLVGDYPTGDDPECQKTLERLKFAKPACLDLEKLAQQGQATSRPLAALRWMQQNMLPENSEDKQKGPMSHAFMTSNPLLPREYFAPKGLDPLVVEMNSQVPHSLLECPGKYTVKVATFTGAVILDQKKIGEIESGKRDVQSRLAIAAEQAHLLTQALRAKGYDAYEFHDLSCSIVTVGSFDHVGTPRADGKSEINPQVHAIMEAFGAPKSVAPGSRVPTEVGEPRKLAGIPFDLQPLPVEVPKKSLTLAYRSSLD